MPTAHLLSDIQLTRRVFQPGDRILARVSVDLESNQYKRLERTIQRFARADVRVLIVNVCKMHIVLKRSDGSLKVLVEPLNLGGRIVPPGVVNLDCSVVDLNADDSLIVSIPLYASNLQRKVVYDWVKEWTGKDVNVMIRK